MEERVKEIIATLTEKQEEMMYRLVEWCAKYRELHPLIESYICYESIFKLRKYKDWSTFNSLTAKQKRMVIEFCKFAAYAQGKN